MVNPGFINDGEHTNAHIEDPVHFFVGYLPFGLN